MRAEAKLEVLLAWHNKVVEVLGVTICAECGGLQRTGDNTCIDCVRKGSVC